MTPAYRRNKHLPLPVSLAGKVVITPNQQVTTLTYDQANRLTTYGNLTASTGSVYNLLQYAGQYTDSESGLIYLRARYYDPATEQFLTRDPLVPLTKQPYGYTGGNPVNMVDLNGMIFGLDNLAAGVVGAVIAAGTTALVEGVTTGHVDMGDVGIAAAGGFIGGALTMEVGPQIGGGVGAGLTDIADQAYHKQSINWGEVLISTGIGVVTGSIPGVAEGGSADPALDNMFSSFLWSAGGSISQQIIQNIWPSSQQSKGCSNSQQFVHAAPVMPTPFPLP